MAEKKTKKTKKTSTRVFVQPKAKVAVRQEDSLTVAEIAEILKISDFDLFMVKQYANIDDGTLMTQTKFKELYKKAIKGR